MTGVLEGVLVFARDLNTVLLHLVNWFLVVYGAAGIAGGVRYWNLNIIFGLFSMYLGFAVMVWAFPVVGLTAPAWIHWAIMVTPPAAAAAGFVWRYYSEEIDVPLALDADELARVREIEDRLLDDTTEEDGSDQ